MAEADILLRPLTEAERRGFLLACDTFELWGTQLTNNAPAPACSGIPAQQANLTALTGKIMCGFARQLARAQGA